MSENKPRTWQFDQEEAARYDLVSAAVSGYRRSAEITAGLIKDKFAGRSIERWLDLGTGTGNSLVDILKQGVKPRAAIGLDKSPSWLMAASAKIKSLELKPGLINADGLKLPFANESVDCISAIQAMHWLMLKSSPADTFAELNRVLKPNGLLVFDESAYHLNFSPKTQYPVTIIDQNDQRRFTELSGRELKNHWFLENIGNLILKRFNPGKTIASTYKDKHGFRQFSPDQLTNALTESGFQADALTTLTLYSKSEIIADFNFSRNDYLPKTLTNKGEKISQFINRLAPGSLRNKGEIFVHWAATKS